MTLRVTRTHSVQTSTKLVMILLYLFLVSLIIIEVIIIKSNLRASHNYSNALAAFLLHIFYYLLINNYRCTLLYYAIEI